MEKEINNVIDRLINHELKEASNCATRGTIKMRVFLKIARLMGISLQSLYDTQHFVRIDPSVSKAFELLWNGYSPIDTATLKGCGILKTVGDEEKSSEEAALLERFLAKDFARPADVFKILSTLEKRSVGWNGKLFRELGYLFGADGLSEGEPNRFEPYLDRLAVPITLGERMDDDSNEELMETHVRAVRTLYRDVKYATSEKIGTTLRKLSLSDADALAWKKRGDGRSSPSSESSDGSVNSDDHSDEYDKYIADRYKKIVGNKINLIINWIRERTRIQEEEKKENFRKRVVATKRKLAVFDEKKKPHENKENDLREIKNMSKNSEREKNVTLNPDHESPKTETNDSSEPENVLSVAAAVPTTSVEPVQKPQKKKPPKIKKPETYDSSEPENVTSSAAAVPTSSVETVQKSKKKKQPKIKKSETSEDEDVKKRKKSEKNTSSKKLKKTETSVTNNNESPQKPEPAETMEFDKGSDSTNVV